MQAGIVDADAESVPFVAVFGHVAVTIVRSIEPVGRAAAGIRVIGALGRLQRQDVPAICGAAAGEAVQEIVGIEGFAAVPAEEPFGGAGPEPVGQRTHGVGGGDHRFGRKARGLREFGFGEPDRREGCSQNVLGTELQGMAIGEMVEKGLQVRSDLPRQHPAIECRVHQFRNGGCGPAFVAGVAEHGEGDMARSLDPIGLGNADGEMMFERKARAARQWPLDRIDAARKPTAPAVGSRRVAGAKAGYDGKVERTFRAIQRHRPEVWIVRLVERHPEPRQHAVAGLDVERAIAGERETAEAIGAGKRAGFGQRQRRQGAFDIRVRHAHGKAVDRHGRREAMQEVHLADAVIPREPGREAEIVLEIADPAGEGRHRIQPAPAGGGRKFRLGIAGPDGGQCCDVDRPVPGGHDVPPAIPATSSLAPSAGRAAAPPIKTTILRPQMTHRFRLARCLAMA